MDRLIAYDDHSFTYDAFDRRMTRDEKPYIWDGKQEIGSPTELRILGEGKGAEIGAAVLLKLDGKKYIPTHDHRGCLVALSDLDGNLIEEYAYTAFGEELTTGNLSPWRFASKRQEGDLVYFGKRYYSPDQGRWLTPDPLGFADGPNVYAYVHNRPFTLVDLHGLWGKSLRQSFSAGWNRFKGANLYARDLAFGALSSMGSRVITPGPTVFDTSPMIGQWEDLSIRRPQDWGQMSYRTLMPCTYDLRHLGPDVSSSVRQVAEGRAALEQGLLAFSATKALQGMRGLKAPRFNTTPIELTSREVSYSGIVKTTKQNRPRINLAIQKIEDFFGGKGKIIENTNGDMILMREDKKIRFDINEPHGDKPHFHIERKNSNGRWKDYGSKHRYYFLED